jgi:secreted PhoX family phosphatase
MKRIMSTGQAPHHDRPITLLSEVCREALPWVLLFIAAFALTTITRAQISISHLSTHATGSYNTAAAEIVSFDPVSDRIFFVNAQLNQVVALNASNPASLTPAFTIDMASYGAVANSVCVVPGGIAVAAEASPKTDPGKVVFFDAAGTFISQVTVGAQPDHVTVAPNGLKVLVANEGEPTNNYAADPQGTISIIDISGGLASLTNANVTSIDFTAYTPAMLPGVRIFGTGATVAQDMEPEYIAVSDDSQKAFVTCQENNAVVRINLATNTIEQITALGLKDHNLPGNGLDASDSPTGVNIANWPVKGMYMPDAADAFTIGGQTYVAYANEGDAREWGTFVEPRRIGNAAYVLDPTVFPNAATLKLDANLGRLNATIYSGDTDNDTDFDEIHVFGSRSFTIRDANGVIVWDSGDQLEQITATAYPTNFNSNNSANGSFDTRSDDKGPEPEAIAVASVYGSTYAFIGLERIGGIVVFDVSVPSAPVFVQYLNNRDFSGNAAAGTALDLGPEDIKFVSATDSPDGQPFLIVGNEISGTVSTFRVNPPPTPENIAVWTYEPLQGAAATPTPNIGSGSSAVVGSMTGPGTATGSTTGCAQASGTTAWALATANPGTTNESSGVEFRTSTVGYENITFSFDQRLSNTATRTVRIQYTLDGTNWINLTLDGSNYDNSACTNRGGLDAGRIDASDPIGSNVSDSWGRRTIDFSAITGANDNPNFGVRILAAHYSTTGQFRQANSVGTVATAGTWRFDNVTFQGIELPVVAVIDEPVPTSLTGFSTTEGTPSAEQTFAITASDLTADLVITAPAGFELREQGIGSYGTSLNLSAPAVSATVEVRLDGVTAGIYSGNVTLASTGAISRSVSVDGETEAPPVPGVLAVWTYEPLQGAAATPTPNIGTGSSALVGSMSGATTAAGSTTGCAQATGTTAWQIGTAAPGTTNESSGVEFRTSTVGHENILFSYDHRHSNSSTRTARIQYTLDGSTWINLDLDAGNYDNTACAGRGALDNFRIDAGDPVGTNVSDSWGRRVIDFSSISGADNNPNFGVRILAAHYSTTGEFRQSNNVTSIATAGTWRFDNVSFTADPITPPVVDITGCSSSQSPYVKPLGAGNTTTSILTVGDLIGGYDMVGIPDGMGAYDNNDGTFTLLMDHELGTTAGVVRDHGFIGSFVSKWVINKSNLCVVSGEDLIQSVLDWNGTAFVPAVAPIGRLCSADLPAVSAFYNAGTGKGTQARIFMSGEEVGNEGRAYGHIATGASAGTSYQLPHLGRFSWENAVANPTPSDKTIVVGLDDTTPGQVYVYVGTKQSTGSEIEKAGLFGGKLYGIKVNGIAVETAALFPATSTPFSLFDLGLVQNTTGAALQTASVAAGVTEFLRPEDGQWDPTNPNVFYFVTTAAFTGANANASRLYKATFTDILNPELGGTIEAVLDGTEGQKMMDNLTVDQRGNVFIQEDVGNQAHIGKVWQYDIATDVLTQVAYHDSARFITGAPLFLTQDEESSGIIDMQDILGKGRYLLNVQAHYPIAGELVEGGQLLEFATGDTIAPCVPALITSITGAQTIDYTDTLALNVAASGTLPLTYSWSGAGSFLFGSSSASALVDNAITGSYTVTVTNACGTDNDAVAVTVNGPAYTGCSSSQSPYVKPLGAGNTTTSILTVGDLIGGYDMVGIPDGMGAYDNNDGTFTLLMDHELGTTAGVVRDHGFIGSFVSKWVINKSNLCVVSGEDLIQSVLDWNGTAFVPAVAPIGRLCSADLPAVSAFYNAGTGKGTQARIFMSGEEVGNEGRAYGHIATGASAGTSYQLPHLGRFSWENAVANPTPSDKTIVVGLDDTTPGQVYVYVGTKQSTGSEIEKAGLFGGKLYGIKVNGIAVETAALFPATSTPFSLFDLGLVQNTTGAALQTASVAAGVTEFLRPEDGQWDPTNPNVFYFVTTAAFTGANANASRLYKATFTDILNPELGGTIEAVLDGTEGQKMMDNLTVDQRGNVFIQEDVGNQAHIGKVWQYDIATDVLTQVAYHDSARFITGAPLFLTQDEESSGIIDMQDILGKGRYLLNVQAHYPIAGELVEGGQLLEFATGDTIAPCVPAAITAITPAQTICSLDQLALSAAASGTLPLTYSWSGAGTFAFGSTNASAIVNGAATGSYALTVTNACGTDNEAVAVTVNTAVLYYADADGDGFGDPAVDSLACSLPVGYAANSTDNCPAVFGVIGSTCDDGNASTGGDVINASCVCEGLPVDCEGVPAGPAQPGTACDDGNPNTVLDTYNTSCDCAGIACTTDLDFVYQADGVHALTWELRQEGTDLLVQSGGGLLTGNGSEATCLPDGCYYLVVTDGGGDGIVNGGYLLKVNSAQRLIDNARDAFGNGGFTSGATSAISGNEGFCLPVGVDRLISTSCDKLDWRTMPCQAEYIVADANAAVSAQYGVSNATSGYQMWWYAPNGGYSFKRFQSHNTTNGLPASATRACHFRINSWSGNQLAEATFYNVKVRGRVNGVYGNWGAACRFMVDNAAAQCPRTNLMDLVGNQFLSCGQSRAIGANVLVHARPVKRLTASCAWQNANRYQFRFRIASESVTIVKTSASNQYWVNTIGLACGKTYDVDVRASFDNGASWCATGDPYGTVCTLTTTACSSSMTQETTGGTAVEARISMYPNPNRGDQVFLSIGSIEEGVETVSVDIFDAFGKRVSARTIAAQDGFVNSVVELNGELSAGFYLVNVTAGSASWSERLVVQP